MTLVSLEKIERRFGDVVVLDGASLRVEDRDRIGIIGDNGAGKTTLIKVLAGIEEPDRGARNARRQLRVGYAAQIPTFAAGDTVSGFVARGDGDFQALENKVRELEARLASHPHDERLLEEYGAIQGAFEAGGGYDRAHECERVLDGLGFAETDRDKRLEVLSGGEKARVALASLMLQPVDLLILDEPTNHLDLQGIEFVESFIGKHPGAVVVISHDRRFLDAVAKDIVEIDSGVANRFKGNYSAFSQQADLQLLATARSYKDQQAFIDKEMAYIRKHMGSRHTAQAKGRLKRLKRLQLIQRPKTGGKEMQLSFGGGRGHAGQTILEAEGLAARLPDGRTLFSDVSFRLHHGETVGLLGRNGSGKSTLLRILCDWAAPSAGTVHRAHKVRAGVFTQEMNDLPQGGTVIDALAQLAPLATGKELRDHLALFMFSGDEAEKPVDTLSGGEKRRLCLARLTWGEYDYLCLDEPTNHLDITAREGLEAALRAFPGAALVISHDRELLDAVTDRVIYLADGHLQVFDGGLEPCLAAIREERSARKRGEPAADRAPERRGGGSTGDSDPAPTPSSKADDRIRNPMMFERLEAEIMELEAALAALRSEMEQPESYANHVNLLRLKERQSALETKLARAYERWENWA